MCLPRFSISTDPAVVCVAKNKRFSKVSDGDSLHFPWFSRSQRRDRSFVRSFTPHSHQPTPRVPINFFYHHNSFQKKSFSFKQFIACCTWQRLGLPKLFQVEQEIFCKKIIWRKFSVKSCPAKATACDENLAWLDWIRNWIKLARERPANGCISASKNIKSWAPRSKRDREKFRFLWNLFREIGDDEKGTQNKHTSRRGERVAMKYRPASTSLQKYQPTKVSAGKELLVIYTFWSEVKIGLILF